MGAYLSEPVTDKDTDDGKEESLFLMVRAFHTCPSVVMLTTAG